MKFAYLIMAHNNPMQLMNLLKLLDYAENDIFLHLDRKSKDLQIHDFDKCLNKAKIHIYKKFKVYHADFSQTRCQTYLLEEACKSYHDYYHLISGSDLPLKKHNDIVTFFQTNHGKQFIHFESDEFCLKDRCCYYHLGYSLMSKSCGLCAKLLKNFDNLSSAFQKKVGIRRHFYCGANWYSITHDLAIDFIKHSSKVLKAVKYTISSDELVLQTFVRCFTDNEYQIYMSTKAPNDYEPLARAIDWNRGNPYVWHEEDYEYLIQSDFIFARKFDSNEDSQIIRRISEYVRSK